MTFRQLGMGRLGTAKLPIRHRDFEVPEVKKLFFQKKYFFQKLSF